MLSEMVLGVVNNKGYVMLLGFFLQGPRVNVTIYNDLLNMVVTYWVKEMTICVPAGLYLISLGPRVSN